ncbi:putative polysaccharide biosynthesis protein [Alteribacter populi]|uniref:putative polysaccharide biosynthesis protein n=1 Tax=Alteribacter populi TaxID=2011011 RepID=UPI0018E267CF|nr:polysaccharide biosynthesis protein [Alteribacter populi]
MRDVRKPGRAEEMRKSKTGDSFIKGALYLSLAAIVVKFLSAVYKVPYQNITGDVGFYVYQQVYPFYGIALVLATYGFPVILSKMISEEYAARGLHGVKTLFRVSLLTVGAVNLVLGGVLFVAAPVLANAIGDANLTWPIRAMATPFLATPFVSVMRGYFQGMQLMAPSALSQVTEQVVRIIVILIFSAWAMKHYGPYAAGSAAALGSFAGTIAALITLIIFIKRKSNQRASLTIRGPVPAAPIHWPTHVKTILAGGFFVCLSAMSLILMQLIDALTMVRLLGFTGLPLEWIAVNKGTYDRGWPVVQMGTVITTSFSLSLVPLIAQASLNKNTQAVQLYTKRALKVGAVFGGAAAIGLVMIMPSLNPMLFTDRQGEFALQILSFTVLPASLFLTGAAVLHGLGKRRALFLALITGLVVKVAANIFLVPLFQIEGAALASVFSFTVMSAFVVRAVLTKSIVGENMVLATFKWMAVIAGMGAGAFVWQYSGLYMLDNIASRAASAGLAISSAAVGGALFLYIVIKGNMLERAEWENLPKINTLFERMERKKGDGSQ